jgi:hypothetical protein
LLAPRPVRASSLAEQALGRNLQELATQLGSEPMARILEVLIRRCLVAEPQPPRRLFSLASASAFAGCGGSAPGVGTKSDQGSHIPVMQDPPSTSFTWPVRPQASGLARSRQGQRSRLGAPQLPPAPALPCGRSPGCA